MSPRRVSTSRSSSTVRSAAALPSLAPRAVASLHDRLLSWYRRNARDLPWRRTRDPYAIWVSEVMLQQTQVATATPYYRQFLRRFPSVRRLASAPLDEVLSAWAGLGYYRRARLLHAAAATVVREHGGRVPAEPEAFASLPGVGRYTAGAVQSIAFGRPLPVLDGNVARVFSRLFALPLNARSSTGARSLWSLAEALVPMRDPGDWNQALMELGATVCLPGTPRCEACPMARTCRARIEGRIEEFPPVAARRATVRVRRAIALVTWRDRVLVERLSGGLLGGMWEPPGVDLAGAASAQKELTARLRREGIQARLVDSGERVRHTITHRRIEVEIWHARLGRAPAQTEDLRLVRRTSPGVAMTALGSRALKPRA
jgi:A/G-specific adenine glycosylase